MELIGRHGEPLDFDWELAQYDKRLVAEDDGHATMSGTETNSISFGLFGDALNIDYPSLPWAIVSVAPGDS